MWRVGALLLWAALLGACGAPTEAPAPELVSESLRPGTYALDVARTTPAQVNAAEGRDVAIPADVLERVQAANTPDAMRLEIRADGTFRLVVRNGDADFTNGGRWEQTPAGVKLTTLTVQGEPAPAEMRLEETWVVEDGCLVATQGGARIWLKRTGDAP